MRARAVSGTVPEIQHKLWSVYLWPNFTHTSSSLRHAIMSTCSRYIVKLSWGCGLHFDWVLMQFAAIWKVLEAFWCISKRTCTLRMSARAGFRPRPLDLQKQIPIVRSRHELDPPVDGAKDVLHILQVFFLLWLTVFHWDVLTLSSSALHVLTACIRADIGAQTKWFNNT